MGIESKTEEPGRTPALPGSLEYTGAPSVFIPSSAGWLFVYILGCFLFLRPLVLLWEGGICRHLTTGEYFVQHWSVPVTNYASALFGSVPCLTHSFFGDVIFGYAMQMFGLNGVVAAVSLAITLSLLGSYQLGRARGMGAISGLILIALVMAACSVHWTARPLIFSYLTFLALYYVTFMSNMSRWWRVLATAIIMVLWVNLHGSFLLGLVMLGIKSGFDFARCFKTVEGDAMRRRFASDLITLAVAAVAICLNLRGFGFYTYVIDYLHHPMILFKSNEWRALDLSLGFQTYSFLSLFAIVLACWALAPKKQSLEIMALTVILFALGVHTMRMVPYFALSVLPAIGPCWPAIRERFANNKFFKFEERIEEQEKEQRSGDAWRRPVQLQALATAAILALFLCVPQFRINDFNPQRMPVQAANYIQQVGMQNKLGFVYDNWGGYLYWRFRKPIFIDDWTDFYPMDFLTAYVNTITADKGWKENLDRYNLSYALLPRDSNLSFALLKEQGWKRAYRDQCSDLFVRTQLGASR